jgi:hypothetical protein
MDPGWPQVLSAIRAINARTRSEAPGLDHLADIGFGSGFSECEVPLEGSSNTEKLITRIESE